MMELQGCRIFISKNVNLEFVRVFLQNWNKNNNPPLPQQEIDSVVDNVKKEKKTHDRKNQIAPLFTQSTENIKRPEDLFSPPGLLQNMFDFCEDIAQVPQPELISCWCFSISKCYLWTFYTELT